MARASFITPSGPSRYETLGNSTVSFTTDELLFLRARLGRRGPSPATACGAHDNSARSIDAQVLAQVDAALGKLGRRAFDDDAAAVEDDDVVGHVEHQLRVLLDQNDRQALSLEPAYGC